VDPVPDPPLLRKFGSAGIEPGFSESVARNSDHWTTKPIRNYMGHIKNSVTGRGNSI
jgi:hypothetical protein